MRRCRLPSVICEFLNSLSFHFSSHSAASSTFELVFSSHSTRRTHFADALYPFPPPLPLNSTPSESSSSSSSDPSTSTASPSYILSYPLPQVPMRPQPVPPPASPEPEIEATSSKKRSFDEVEEIDGPVAKKTKVEGEKSGTIEIEDSGKDEIDVDAF